MPAPTLVVVFIDDDGDEFPISAPVIEGLAVVDYAEREAAKLVEEGRWRPNGELRHVRTDER